MHDGLAAGDEGNGATRFLRVPSAVDIAIRALGRIDAGGGKLVKAGEIGVAENIPRRFLSTVLIALRAEGFISSRRGMAGGYWLSRPAEEISIGEVFAAIDRRAPHPVRPSTSATRLWTDVESQISERL